MKETHPARDAEFLSRLHDGELSAGERAHFESHRAHCAECRNAAAEFEAALSLYRSSRPTPASPDLAGRILRKLQASAAPRRRFGPSFGIDLRWAGAFAAAVVAAIIGSTIVGRHEAREGLARSAGPIPIVVQSRPATVSEPSSPEAKPPSDAPPETAGARGAPRLFPGPSPRRTSRPALAPPRNSAARSRRRRRTPSGSSASAEDQAGGKRKPRRLARAEEREKRGEGGEPGVRRAACGARSGRRRPLTPASAGAAPGMGGAPRAQASEAQAVAQAGRARLRVEALDGMPGPALASAAPDVSAALRGRSWIVLVEPGGQVRSVREQPLRDKRRDAAASDELKAEAPPPELLDLRFAAGDRERRLLVRVE